MLNRKAALKDEANSGPFVKTGQRYFIRLNKNERAQHIILVICFIVLAVTGFMVKIPEEIVQRFGTSGTAVFYFRGLLHRMAGTIMILVCAYHGCYLLLAPAGRRYLIDMFPKPRDLKDMIFNIFYYLGFKKEPPEFDRFSYKQKIEYFALIAGSTLMSLSGLLLWTEYRWSKFILDIAKIVHGMEAILACLAIIVWHLYEVHLRPHKFPIDNLWITGVIDEEEMKAEHPLHYKRIMDDPELRKIYILGGDQEEVNTPTARQVTMADLPRVS